MTSLRATNTLLLLLLLTGIAQGFPPGLGHQTKANRDHAGLSSSAKKSPQLQMHDERSSAKDVNTDFDQFVDLQRRNVWKKAVVQCASVAIGATAFAVLSRPAWASSRSRSDSYPFQKTEAEWKELLSPLQYNILRQGGTERPGYSILEGEKRPGTFKCAGCDTPLFVTSDKFNSGTGWPSFARGLDGVEVDSVSPIMANLAGAELRCKTCGGHLGDVFSDGFLFQGTQAAVTGKRYCIDGAALVFYPNDDDAGVNNSLRGDLPAKSKEPSTLPSFLDPPKVNSRERRDS